MGQVHIIRVEVQHFNAWSGCLDPKTVTKVDQICAAASFHFGLGPLLFISWTLAVGQTLGCTWAFPALELCSSHCPCCIGLNPSPNYLYLLLPYILSSLLASLLLSTSFGFIFFSCHSSLLLFPLAILSLIPYFSLLLIFFLFSSVSFPLLPTSLFSSACLTPPITTSVSPSHLSSHIASVLLFPFLSPWLSPILPLNPPAILPSPHPNHGQLCGSRCSSICWHWTKMSVLLSDL